MLLRALNLRQWFFTSTPGYGHCKPIYCSYESSCLFYTRDFKIIIISHNENNKIYLNSQPSLQYQVTHLICKTNKDNHVNVYAIV